ncbi:hypothetical protein SNARM312S_02202 [Streptomyces narbonensis]
MSMGLGVVGAVHTNKTPRTLADTTPIARLTEEQDIVVVGKDFPYKTIQELLAAWKKDPGKLPVGGGSSPGGPDHLAPMLMAQAAGIAPKDVNYVPFDGGGELLASILGNKVGFGVSGVGEYLDQIKAGELRLLAVTGPKRVPGLDAPTLREAGLDTEFTNWRGIVAPPNLSDAEREKLVDLVTELHGSPQWRESLKTHGWNDAFLPGEEFGENSSPSRTSASAPSSRSSACEHPREEPEELAAGTLRARRRHPPLPPRRPRPHRRPHPRHRRHRPRPRGPRHRPPRRRLQASSSSPSSSPSTSCAAAAARPRPARTST